ncbi:MAG: hypothetical protein ACAH89_05385 [Rariglobus sp.]
MQTLAPGTLRPARIECLLLAAMLVLLWLNTLGFPLPTGPGLDPSWQSTLVYAHREDLQMGRDLIFTYGPLGWLNSTFYPPGSITAKLVWELAGKLLLVGTLVGISLRLPRLDRWLFLTGVLLFVPLFADVLLILVITLTLLAWGLRADTPRWLAVTVVLGIAVLAQLKFTCTLLSFAGVATTLAGLCLQRHPRRAALLGMVFVSAYLLIWMLAGQPLAALPQYWRQSWDISQGYPWAMSLIPQRPWALPLGLAAGAVHIALILYLLLRLPKKALAWPALIFVAGALFLSWKHGFTRADGHVLSFFLMSLLITFALPGLLDCRPGWRWHWLGPAICLLGLHDQQMLLNTPRFLCNRLEGNARKLTRLSHLDDPFILAPADSTLAHAVGGASVDVYNYEQGVVQLAGLRHHPRPIIQGYNAYTPALLGKNLEFLRSPRSADYVLLKIQTVDHRHPMLDDSLSLLEIPLRYSHVADIDDYALFRKRPETSPPDPLRNAPQLLHQTVVLGEIINLPPAHAHALWLTLNAQPSLLGKLRAALYQPAELYIVLTKDDGREIRYRLIAPMAKAGLLVQPLVESTAEYLNFTQGISSGSVQTVRFEARIPSEKRYWSTLEVNLSSLTAYPINKIESPLLSPSAPFNLLPVRITAGLPEERFGLDQKTAILLHAPGEMRFNIPAGIRTLRASFGLRSGSYNEGRTDGVTFEVVLVSSEQPERILFQRHLDPVSVQTDQGTQTLELSMDESRTSRTVVLRTLPGPRNNTKWDWSYWSQVRFLP